MVDHLLTTTRAVRKRLDLTRPVPNEIIVECLRIAIQAPTGSNAQEWRWLVISDPDVKAAIGELYRKPPTVERTGPAVPDSPQQRRVMSSVRYLAKNLQHVPVLVVPCTLDAGGAAGWGPSIYPAVWNFMLALRSRGLGSAMTTTHLYRRREAAEILGVPPDFQQACLVPVAYHLGEDFQPADRLPVERFIFENRWGQPLDRSPSGTEPGNGK